MKKTYYTYILQCNDESYYTGVTNNIETRISEHKQGVHPECYTFNRRPVKLVYCEYNNDINISIAREKQIKGWSRVKKEALIINDIDQLLELSNHNNVTYKCRSSINSE